MTSSGIFEITLEPQNDDLLPAGRMTISKVYSGGLEGLGKGQMVSKRTENGASVYAAIEEFEGRVDGKKGAFTLFHNGLMSKDKQELKVVVVEGSGTGELESIQGDLVITQEDGIHNYEFSYTL